MKIDTDTFVYLNLLLTFGAPMLIMVRELVLLKRNKRRPDGGVEQQPKAPTPWPSDDNLPPLPPSLQPDLEDRPVTKPRVLEPA